MVDAPVPIGRDSRIILLGSKQGPLPYRVRGSKLIVTTPRTDPAKATRSKHAYVFRVFTPPRGG